MCATGDLGLMGEETRLQIRLMEAGYKGIYAPDAVVHHWVPKNRCDEKWTVQRQYRAGLTLGAELVTSLPDKYCSLFGIPCYLIKEYCTCYLSFVKSKIIRRSQKDLFPIRYHLAYLKGQITSVLQKKQY